MGTGVPPTLHHIYSSQPRSQQHDSQSGGRGRAAGGVKDAITEYHSVSRPHFGDCHKGERRMESWIIYQHLASKHFKVNPDYPFSSPLSGTPFNTPPSLSPFNIHPGCTLPSSHSPTIAIPCTIVAVLPAAAMLLSSSGIRKPFRQYRHRQCQGAWTLINGQEVPPVIELLQIPGCSMLDKLINSRILSYVTWCCQSLRPTLSQGKVILENRVGARP